MPFSNASGISIYYEVHGYQGLPLLMIHGGGCAIGDWLPEQIQAFAKYHQVIVFDNRGMGKSDAPLEAEAYTMAKFAEDTVGILDTLKINKAHIYGLSLGGMVAQHVALNYPDRVLKLVLASTIAAAPGKAGTVSPPQELFDFFDRPRSGDRAQDSRDAWVINYSAEFIEANRELLERIVQSRVAYPAPPPHAMTYQYDAIFNSHDAYERLPNIRHSTLVLGGTKDIVLPFENSRIIAKCIPKAKLIEYADAGHGCFVERREEFERDILEFISE